jgi:hypothetical protein
MLSTAMERTLKLMIEEDGVTAGRGPAVTTVDMLVTEGLATWTVRPQKEFYTNAAGRECARLTWAADITEAGEARLEG